MDYEQKIIKISTLKICIFPKRETAINNLVSLSRKNIKAQNMKQGRIKKNNLPDTE